jgi:hypothetical protein
VAKCVGDAKSHGEPKLKLAFNSSFGAAAYRTKTSDVVGFEADRKLAEIN